MIQGGVRRLAGEDLASGRLPRLLVVLSNILGIRQVSGYLRDELAQMFDEWEMEFVVFDESHYRSHRHFSRWNRWKGTFESAYCARAMVAEANPASFDAYLVTGPELMHALAPWTRDKPLIVYTDSTDKLAHAQVAALDPSPLAGMKRHARHHRHLLASF